MNNPEDFNPAPPALPTPAPTPPPTTNWAASCLKSCMTASFVFVLVVLLSGLALFRMGCSAVETAARQATGVKKGVASGTAPQVVEIRINGMIQDATPASWFEDPGSSPVALQRIRESTEDAAIRGILLHLNSGGGGITASDILWNSLRAFKHADTNRVVVVMMGSVAASGAYYIAAAADSIVANPTTLTGSIGVIMNSFNIGELAEKIGLKSVTIKSGGNKDILNPFKDLTPEQERMLQNMVDAMHTRFVAIVAQGRGLDEMRVRAIADGRILLAEEARTLGLIDRIGYVDDARDEMARRLGATPDYLDPDDQPGFLRLLRSPTFWGASFFHAADTFQRHVEGSRRLLLE